MFKGFNISAIGASHISKGIVCQDCSGYFCNKEFAVAVVSDGHGSQKHFRSNIGSKIAVDVSVEAVKEFIQKIKESKYQFPNDYGEVLRQLESNIIYRWNTGVNQHFEENHLSETEEQTCVELSIEKDKPERFYGATLLVGVLAHKFAFAIQIGDGACVFINEKHAPSQPSELEDERLGFGLTSSLCDLNAIDNFRHIYTEDVPDGIILASDGVVDSYTPENLLSFSAKILRSLQTDIDLAEKDLKEWLPVLSEKGSRDDMSISIAYKAPTATAKDNPTENTGNIFSWIKSKFS